jgi:hypothetical protein
MNYGRTATLASTLVILMLITIVPAYAQASPDKAIKPPPPPPPPSSSSTTFEKAIATQYSYAEDVQQTSDGGYVVGADSCSSTFCYFALVVKLDSNSNLQWQKQFQFPGLSTQLYALRQTSEGGYVWAGGVQNSNGCSECALVVKLDSNGNVQWQHSYSGLNEAQANDIQQTADGGYVIAGYTFPSQSTYPPPVQAWIEKLDSSGNLQWQEAVGSSNTVYGNSVQQTSDGGYVLAGYSGSPPIILVAKFDSSGNVKWQTLYTAPVPTGSIGGQIAYSLIQTSDGGYLIGGQVNTQSALALKLSSGGSVQWANTYTVNGASSQFGSVRQTTDGGYVFAGYYYTGASYGGYNSWIVRTDSGGNLQWQKTYGATTQSREFQKIALTSDGGFVAVGWTLQFSLNNQAYIVKTDSAGNVNSCSDVHSTSATTANASVTSSSAHLSISVPTNGGASGKATASSTSFTLTKEC